MEYEEWLRHKDLDYRDGVLYFADMNTLELAGQYGTPIYITNEQMIRKRYRELKNLLDAEYKSNQIHYAVKANSNLAILKILKSEGAGYDCTSQGEIYACLKAGVDPKNVLYTGNMFTNKDFEFAVGNNVAINLDSISQLARLITIYNKLGKIKKIISFRINPEFGAGHHAHTITAGKEIKFGILENQVLDAYKLAKNAGFQKFGIHQHIGSGIIDPKDFEKATENYLSIVKTLASSLDIKFEFVDFGGGLGIPYKPVEEPLDLNIYKEIVIKPFKEIAETGIMGSPVFKIEPGRYLSAESTIILTQINTIKDNGFKLFAGIDAGFNTLIRPTMYGSYHHIELCNKKGKEETMEFDIAGPICESGDILGRKRMFPKLEEGDTLAILDAGAYGFAMASSYNSRPRPAELLINNKSVFEIRRAETLDNLLESQTIPKHLE
jgi:diaminopimelate decarboxylase